MCYFLAGTTDKKLGKKAEPAEAGFWVVQENAHCNVSACSREAN